MKIQDRYERDGEEIQKEIRKKDSERMGKLIYIIQYNKKTAMSTLYLTPYPHQGYNVHTALSPACRGR